MARLLVVLMLLALLPGCGLFGKNGYFRDRKDDYLKAKMLKPLDLPKGLETNAISNPYAVPPIDVHAARPDDFEVPKPASVLAGDTTDMVRIQSLGAQEWILVQLYPGQVWPRIKDYLISHHIPLAIEDGKRGIIETGWVKGPDDSGYQRYRFTVRQGVQRETSEVHLLQLSAPAGAEPSQTVQWPAASSDYKREKAVLKEFATYLASTADTGAAVSLVAQGIDTSRRMYLVKNPEPLVRVNLGWERAVASTGYALNKAGFKITKQDATKGTFAVTYEDKHKEKRGIFRKFWDFITLAGLRHGKESNEFVVTLKPAPQTGWVEIHLQGREKLSDDRREQLLSLIMEYLT